MSVILMMGVLFQPLSARAETPAGEQSEPGDLYDACALIPPPSLVRLPSTSAHVWNQFPPAPRKIPTRNRILIGAAGAGLIFAGSLLIISGAEYGSRVRAASGLTMIVGGGTLIDVASRHR